jgi:hypothetical protein
MVKDLSIAVIVTWGVAMSPEATATFIPEVVVTVDFLAAHPNAISAQKLIPVEKNNCKRFFFHADLKIRLKDLKL